MQARMLYGHGGELHDTAAGALNAGDVVQIAGVPGVVAGSAPIVSGQRYTVNSRGVAEFTCASGVTFTEGDTVDWDDADNTAVADGDFAVGKAEVAKTSGQLVVRVNLNEFGEQEAT